MLLYAETHLNCLIYALFGMLTTLQTVKTCNMSNIHADHIWPSLQREAELV